MLGWILRLSQPNVAGGPNCAKLPAFSLAWAARSEALLGRHSFVPLRRAIAILCMAIAVMLSGQSYISLMDRIDHAHHHVHFANPLAGDVAFCS